MVHISIACQDLLYEAHLLMAWEFVADMLRKRVRGIEETFGDQVARALDVSLSIRA